MSTPALEFLHTEQCVRMGSILDGREGRMRRMGMGLLTVLEDLPLLLERPRPSPRGLLLPSIALGSLVCSPTRAKLRYSVVRMMSRQKKGKEKTHQASKAQPSGCTLELVATRKT